jgi:hypothetical protein
MTGTAQAISLLTSALQLANEAVASANELAALLERSRAEGREPTDAELDAARASLLAARDRLASS